MFFNLFIILKLYNSTKIYHARHGLHRSNHNFIFAQSKAHRIQLNFEIKSSAKSLRALMAAWLNSIRVLLNVHNQVDVTSSIITMPANVLAFGLGVLFAQSFGGTAVKWKTPVGCKQLGGIEI